MRSTSIMKLFPLCAGPLMIHSGIRLFSTPSRDIGQIRLGKMIESMLANNHVQANASGSYSLAITQNKGIRRGEDVIVTPGTHGIHDISILMDGHGGQSVVKYAGRFLQESLLKACNASTTEKLDNWRDRIQSCFVRFQHDIRQRRLLGGAAVVTMFVDFQSMKVSFAWAGDAEAIIIRKGSILFRTTRHSLDSAAERARITSHVPRYKYIMHEGYLCTPEGSCVMPTRGLGDLDMEDAGYICVPEVSDFMVLEPGDIVILASDGLWDVLDADFVVQQFVKADPKTEILDIGATLARTAVKQWAQMYGRASEADDISLMIYKPVFDGATEDT
eukprot:TRINITY_DN43331_c0_g1_i1.p1 TRINITY_DN43331_c0_g1~~TRINITY_DN43331_c0_g1_i1.p1  ORF type:complete len:349 (+),score=42.68 TRINITY_DN43331_c0_g1_i1:53-1048(+)